MLIFQCQIGFYLPLDNKYYINDVFMKHIKALLQLATLGSRVVSMFKLFFLSSYLSSLPVFITFYLIISLIISYFSFLLSFLPCSCFTYFLFPFHHLFSCCLLKDSTHVCVMAEPWAHTALFFCISSKKYHREQKY
jgi:hypothetical protein